MIVVATSEPELAHVRVRLDALGATTTRVVSPRDARRSVLATALDDWTAERIAAALRAEGFAAVTRPDGGPRLDEWMRHTRPLTFDDRISVCFAWSEHHRTDLPGLVELGPGGFGNGAHPSTRLVIDQLLDRLTGGERVLDVGCGSGVLGLCALRLGAAQVVAIDIKPDAVAATRRNAELNGLEALVEATVGPLETIPGSFDVVLANIGRGAVVDLAAQLVRLVADGGWLAVSGISPPQCSLVAPFLVPLEELERRSSGDWSSLVLTNRGQPAAQRPLAHGAWRGYDA